MRIHLTASQVEAHRALQAFLVHIGDPCRVFEDESASTLVTLPEAESDELVEIRTYEFSDNSSLVSIDLQQHFRWCGDTIRRQGWQATKVRFWPNLTFRNDRLEFRLKPVHFSSGRLELGGRVWHEARFKYELEQVSPDPVGA